MSRFLKALLVALVAFALPSCVHFWPGEDPVDPTLIKVTLRILPADTLTLYDNGNPFVATADYYGKEEAMARYYIELYVDEKFSDELVYADTLSVTEDHIRDVIERNLELHALHYRLVVWQDITDPSSALDDFHYRVPALNAVKVLDSRFYVASTDGKDAQSVSFPFDLSQYARQWGISRTIEVPLIRPLAKMVIVSADLEKFAKAYYANYPSESGTPIDQVLKDCTVRVSYNGYVPTGFNAVTDKLNDSQTGYGFVTETRLMNEKEAVIGFDYILVGQNTSVNVKVEVIGAGGEVINCSDGINVPLERGKVTVVKGDFLTRDYGGGIGIDPGFDGEYNINV